MTCSVFFKQKVPYLAWTKRVVTRRMLNKEQNQRKRSKVCFYFNLNLLFLSSYKLHNKFEINWTIQMMKQVKTKQFEYK